MPTGGKITMASDGKISLKNGVIDICDDCCSSLDCFDSCQSTPTNEPTCGAFAPGCGATIPSPYDQGATYSDETTYHVWTWEAWLFGTDTLTFTLEIRCLKSDKQVGARSITDDTSPDMGGSDSTWIGFKDITGSLSCGGDSNLSGSFDLEGLEDGCETTPSLATFTL